MGWEHMNCFDVISMPDCWEYPWFAAWVRIALGSTTRCERWSMRPRLRKQFSSLSFVDVTPSPPLPAMTGPGLPHRHDCPGGPGVGEAPAAADAPGVVHAPLWRHTRVRKRPRCVAVLSLARCEGAGCQASPLFTFEAITLQCSTAEVDLPQVCS